MTKLSKEESNYYDRCTKIAAKLNLNIHGFTLDRGFSVIKYNGINDSLPITANIPHFLMIEIERLINNENHL